MNRLDWSRPHRHLRGRDRSHSDRLGLENRLLDEEEDEDDFRALNGRARFCDDLGMPGASRIGVAGKAPNGAGFDSPGRSEAKPWVTSTTDRKPQRGAIPIGRPSARWESRPVGPFSRDYSVPRAASAAADCALGYRISPHSGLRAQSGTDKQIRSDGGVHELINASLSLSAI